MTYLCGSLALEQAARQAGDRALVLRALPALAVCAEIASPAGPLIVFGTIITYANDEFVALSGFSREELVGSPHNLVRHPDMPAEAFKDLWDTAKSGKPWHGMVKNRRKDGGFYWVDANVTPVMARGQLQGYVSIRSRPTRAQIAEAVLADLRRAPVSALQEA